ncbi:putative uncharacterized protein DDB_G0282133 [Calliphora vicina]|uniref:putative uncharacterized protein DDB_G0282133 n=1 Tax=Calliphora vicina TaxID=7373 RepID=UPI00325B1D69
MSSLIHLILILVLNQSLYVVTNAQQDLEIESGVWKYPTSQFSSTNSQPYISSSYNLQTIRNSAQQENLFGSNTNSNMRSHKAMPSLFNSHYDSIIHITPEAVPTNLQLNNKHNWNDITEGRSIPIYRNIISSNEQPPVELHHGYRYFTPAISFSNIDNFKNVIYNELGLSESPSGTRISSSPQGFALQQPVAEIGNNIRFLTENTKSKAEISSHETNFVGYQNSQNITILTPVKNLTFPYNYSQTNGLNNVLKGKLNVNQFSLSHRQVTAEETGNQLNKKSSFLPKYDGVFNSTSNLNASGQISEIKTPETSLHSDIPLNLNVSNVQPNQKELALNIRPSIEIFQNTQPGNIVTQSSSQSPLKLSDMGSYFPHSEFNHDFNKAYNQHIQQYENFVNNKQSLPNHSHNIGLNIPTISTISDVSKPSDSSYSGVFNRVLPQISGGGRPIEAIHENYQNYKIYQRPTQNISLNNNNQISPSEYEQYYATSQQQHMPIQSIYQQNKIGNPSHNIGLNIPTISTNSDVSKPSDSIYSTAIYRLLPQISGGGGGHPIEAIHENYQNYQNHQRPTQNNSFNNNNRNSPSEYKQPNATSQQQLMPIQSIYQQNKIGNQIQNQINKDSSTIFSSPTYQTPESKKQNNIIFPTNLFLIDSGNLAARLPIESNLYPYSKIHETNGSPMANSNVQKRYPEHSYHHTSFNNNIQNNAFKIIDGNNINQIYAVHTNKKTPQIETHSNQLTNIYSLKPTFAVNNEHIDPRTSNYRMKNSNYTAAEAQSAEFTSNKTPITYNPAQTSIVFPKSDEKIRLPHLVYGPPT